MQGYTSVITALTLSRVNSPLMHLKDCNDDDNDDDDDHNNNNNNNSSNN